MPNRPNTSNKTGDSLEPVFKAVEDYMREVTKLYGMPQEGDMGFERAIERKVQFLIAAVTRYATGLSRTHLELNSRLTGSRSKTQDQDSITERSKALARVAQNVKYLLKLAHPEKAIDISYAQENLERIKRFSDWQRKYHGIFPGDENFYIYDTTTDTLLYVVPVTADSVLTAAAELMRLISAKF